jgi:SAM-dependent methyltransferase
MFSETAELYDLIYAPFKDYPAEVRQIAGVLERVHPGARTVLDAGCGTGAHACLLARDHGFTVDGFDLDPVFVRIAQDKHPAGRFTQADMADFDLGRRYDAVLCLFSSIGYVRTLANVERTLRCFRRHLAPGGVVLVEPWFPPGVFQAGRLDLHTAGAEDVKVCRMARTEVEGRLSRLQFEYLIGRADGIVHRSEVHELGLFTVAEMTAAFTAAGLAVDYDPAGPSGRGLYVATPAG